MKNTQAEKDALELMRPGAITAQGFLGPDTRSLADMIESDMEAWRRLGLDEEQAADFLEKLKVEGQKGLGEPITVDGHLVVTAGDARGVLPCPFHDGTYHKNSVEVLDERSGTRVVYSDLSLHLLRSHHFCQGAGSPFRIEPETVASMMR